MSNLMLRMFSLPQDILDEQSIKKRLLDLEQVRQDRIPKKKEDLPTRHKNLPLEEQNLSVSISRQVYINSIRYWIGWSRISFYNFFWNSPPSIDKHERVVWLFPASQIPDTMKYPLNDDFFAQQRFCGPQTSSITKLDILPEWAPKNDIIIGKLKKGQLYIVNYSLLKDCKLKPKVSLPHVIGIFSCSEGPTFNTECLFIDGQIVDSSNPGLWAYAKASFQVNDSIYFFVINRLCGAFLFVEPIVLYFYRNISTKHPLYPLLHPLFYGHATACKWIRNVLLKPEGLLHQLLPLSVEGTQDLIKLAYKHWSFEGTNFVNKLSQRQMLHTEGYAYAEDGKELFAISQLLITAYINRIYPTDKDVADDTELRAWILDTGNPKEGGVKGFPQKITKKEVFIQLLSHIFFLFIFDRYVVHQGMYDHMSFMPSFPLNIVEYAKHSPPLTAEEVFHLMSDEKRTLSQMHAIYVFCHEILPKPQWNLQELPQELADFMLSVEKQLQMRRIAMREKLKTRLSPYRHFIMSHTGFVVTNTNK